jgi:hypothetical protein
MICRYGGQEKLKGVISFFFNGLFLEGKSISLLKFFFCLGVYLKLCLRSKLIWNFINMHLEDRSWMYQSGDVLAHFKGFLEVAAQHTTLRKKR